MKVRIQNIRRGKGEARQHIVYAELINAETNELLIAATLKYIVEEIEVRNYLLES